MKLSLIVGAAAGYVLGAKAGRDRYDQIVRTARRVAGSQTVQSTAGVLQAQVEDFATRARDVVSARIGSGSSTVEPAPTHMANGYHR
jgi:tryptophan synthase beta subunit